MKMEMKLMQGFLMSVVFPRIMMMSVAVKKPELPNGLKSLKKRGTYYTTTHRPVLCDVGGWGGFL
jgi:hypothetical protein